MNTKIKLNQIGKCHISLYRIDLLTMRGFKKNIHDTAYILLKFFFEVQKSIFLRIQFINYVIEAIEHSNLTIQK